MDPMVIVHFDHQLKVCANFAFLLCKQRTDKMKTIQDQSSGTDKIRMK